ncbi:hypothetical protein CPB86DRAFT_722648 [Serendipita vermifera]|nr:hypothetical protein CPB86DRAFT_722648 [Serendipita vermifera]
MSTPLSIPRLLDLPNELLEQILISVHPLDVVICRRVCKDLQQLIDCSSELQLRIELALDGSFLGARGDLSLNALQDYFEKRRAAFETVTPIVSWKEYIEYAGWDQYEICDGIWAHSVNRNIFTHTFTGILYQELIPPGSGTKPWVLEWRDIGVVISDFSFWIGGDLQYLIEPRMDPDGPFRRIHFRTMSTNEPHPNSVSPYVDLFKQDYSSWDSCTTLAFQDRLAVFLIGSEGDRRKRGALVIDSTTGATIMPYTTTLDAAFLTKDKILLMFNGEGENPKFTFAIYSIENQDVLCRFLLPIKEASSGEFFTRPPSTYGDKCLSSQAKRFLTDESLDILPVELYLNDTPPNPCFFVISVAKLLRTMERLRESNPDRLTFEWDEWGPDITRFLPFQRMSPPSSRPTFGSRMAVFYTDEGEELILSKRKIAILDFNPRPIKQGNINAVGRENIRIIDTETEWRGPYSDNVIKSRLPYRILRKEWLADGDDCHLEANTMILRRDHHSLFHSFMPQGDQALDSLGEDVGEMRLDATTPDL